MTRDTLPLRLTQKGGQPASLTLGGVDISRFVAEDGLTIEYESGGPLSMPAQPVVTIRFGWGALDLDFDVDLLEQMLADAKAKVAG
jgi:hypothetical protein